MRRALSTLLDVITDIIRETMKPAPNLALNAEVRYNGQRARIVAFPDIYVSGATTIELVDGSRRNVLPMDLRGI